MEYNDEVIECINENVDLLEYASNGFDFEKKGKDYFTNCPLHSDITASLCITPSKNLFYCYSCGVGGSVIGWFMHIEHLSYEMAISKGIKLANVDLSTMCYSPTVKLLKKIRKLRQKCVSTEHSILSEKEYEKYKKLPVEEWLNEGIRQREIDLFDIRIDQRSNRIVYPVRDMQRRLINVKGRTRFEDYKSMELMKYMNYFPVGTMDYFQGLDVTLPYIKEKNEIIIFESLKSVMKCFGWAYKNTASAEKHSITDEQMRLLIRLKVDVVFAYDSDVSYRSKDIVSTINKLKRFTNVYLIEDKTNLLGGVEAKNSPADLGLHVFEKLYTEKRRVI